MTTKMSRFVLPALLAVIALVALPAAANTIDTYPGWNGTDTICCIGYPNTATYGEVLQSPGGTITNFSYWMQQPVGFQFQAFVAEWDNVNYHTMGTITWGNVQTVTDPSLHQYDFGGPLSFGTTAGDYYVLGVSIDNVYNNDSGFSAGPMGGDIFAGGNSTYYFAWSNDSGDSSLLSQNWNNTGCADNSGACGNAAFSVTFGGPTTPEPSSLILLGTGVVGLAGVIRRKMKV